MKNKRVLIFGGSGSLGITLINRLIKDNDISVFSRDESKHWKIKNYIKNSNLSFSVGDIRDYRKVREEIVKYNPHVIIIASALKHVDVCEMSPDESILTNIKGPQNVADAVSDKITELDNLETVLMVSTDKACSPINVYGMCKAISERVVLEKGIRFVNPKFLAVRYGNVIQSTGSIIPVFIHQAMNEENFTITRNDMTRFLMTLDDSVDLILNTIKNGKSGETWIPKLRSMRIKNLVDLFSERYKKSVIEIGIRCGEKIHESLINETESIRTIVKEDHYIIRPFFDTKVYNDAIYDYNSSSDLMEKTELLCYLNNLNIFELENL